MSEGVLRRAVVSQTNDRCCVAALLLFHRLLAQMAPKQLLVLEARKHQIINH